MPADDKNTAEETAQMKPPKPGEDEPTFTLERLQRESYAIVGEPPHVVAGAFAGVASNKEITKADAKKRIAAWLKSPVETENEQEA